MPNPQPDTEGGAPARPKVTRPRDQRMVRRGLLRIMGRYRTALAGLMATCLVAQTTSPLLLANPSGEQVIAGQAIFERSLDLHGLTITQGTDRAVINWGDFSIGLGETTQFVQPGATSATLNRVMNGLTSRIDGSLLANGQIYLINPNGIIVGPTGRIDVGSFVGSTLDVSDENFMAGGDLTFAGPSQASVVNFGTINGIGGDVFLIGRHVENHGLLNAPNGTVGLAAGEEVLLRAAGEERLFVQPTAGGGGGGTGVTNTGTIQAATAELKAHGNMYALAINNGGVIRATGVQKKGGRVFLSAPGGAIESTGEITAKDGAGGGGIVKVDASGGGSVKISGKVDAIGDDGTGGQIQITGDTVEILEGAELLASGLTGGGTVEVGGGFQGQDPEITNAIKTFIDYGAVIRADSYQKGDAGFIVVWADDTTEVHGDISARAYGESGDGGFVELSGKKHLKVTSLVDARSENGDAGSLLLDPGTVIIYHDIYGEGGEGLDFFSDLYISNQLELSDLTIKTSEANGSAGSLEDIYIDFDVDISWEADTLFRLEAGNNISFFSDEGGIEGPRILNFGEGRMEFVAGMDIYVGNGTELGTFATDTGNANAGDISFQVGNNIYIDRAIISTINPEAPIGTNFVGDVSVRALGNIEVGNNALVITDEGNISFVSDRQIGFYTSEIRSGGGGDIFVEANFDSDQDESSYDGIYLSTNSAFRTEGGDITFRGRAGFGGGTGIFISDGEGGDGPTIDAAGGDILFHGVGQDFGGSEPFPQPDIHVGYLVLDDVGGKVTFDGSVDVWGMETDGSDWTLEFLGGGYLADFDLDHTGSLVFEGDAQYEFGRSLSFTGGTTLGADLIFWGEEDSLTLGAVLLTDNVYITTNAGDVTFGATDAQGEYTLGIETWQLPETSNHGDELHPGNINLFNSGNELAGLTLQGGFVQVYNATGITQDGAWYAEELVVHTDGSIVLDADGLEDGNDFGDTTFRAASLVLREIGEITDREESHWIVTGLVDLEAFGEGRQNITLDNANNVLGDIRIREGFHVTIFENDDVTQWEGEAWDIMDLTINAQGGAGSIVLNGSHYDGELEEQVYNRFRDLTLTGASLSLTEADAITDSNAVYDSETNELLAERGWKISGTTSITALPYFNGEINEIIADIYLDNTFNVLGDIDLTNPVDELYITENDAITQTAAGWDANWVTLDSQGNDIILNSQFNVLGENTGPEPAAIFLAGPISNLTIRNNADIIQGNAWKVLGTTTLNAGSHNIHIESDLNEFGDGESASSGLLNLIGNVVRVANMHAIRDGDGGFQIGELHLTTFDGDNIVLDNENNTFSDEIYLHGSNMDVLTIVGQGNIEQGNTWSANLTTIRAIPLNAESGGNIRLDFGENVFGDTTFIGRRLTLTEGDNITDGDAWNISGLVTLNAVEAAPNEFRSIYLDNDDNVLGNIKIESEVNELTITEDDDITQDSRWLAGRTRLDAEHPEGTTIHNIYLDKAGNRLGDISISGTVGNLTIREDDQITQDWESHWHTTGDTILDAGQNSIYLWSDNVLGNVGVTAGSIYLTENDDITSGDHLWTVRFYDEEEEQFVGGFVYLSTTFDWESEEPVHRNISLTNANNILGDIEIDTPVNQVTIYENDDITQGDTWHTIGDTTLVSTGNVYLDYYYYGEGFSYNDLGDLTITAVNAYVREGGAITDGAAWNVSGEVHLMPFSLEWDSEEGGYVPVVSDVILDNLDNQFGTVYLYDYLDFDTEAYVSPLIGNVLIKKQGDLNQGNVWNVTNLDVEVTGAINLNFTDGEGGYNAFGDLTLKGASLNLVENDDITDGGAWNISGSVVLDANPANATFLPSIILDNEDNVLGDISIISQVADLTIVEDDEITQSGAWTSHALGTTIFATGIDEESEERHAITLLADNRFGSLTVTGGEVKLREIENIEGFGAWNTGDVTLDADGNAIAVNNGENVLGDIKLVGTVSNLDLREADDVTQNGAWKVTTGTVDAGEYNIYLDHEDNEIDLIGFRANNLSFTNNKAITQGGAWDISGLASIDSNNNAVTLANTSNTILSLNIAGTLPTLHLTNAIDINQNAAWKVTGATTLHGPNINLTQDNEFGAIHIVDGVNDINITEVSDITQGNAWKPTGSTILRAPGHHIDLTNPGNVLNDLVLEADTAHVVNNNDITQGGAWDVGAVTLNSNGNRISLTSLTNNIHGPISIVGSIPQLTLFNDANITQSGAWTVTGNTVLVADGASINLTAANVFANLAIFADEDLDLTEADHITQNDAWYVGGTATLNAGANDITLTLGGNSFGALDLTAANATVFEVADMNLAGAAITQVLDITAENNIAQSGRIGVNTLYAEAITGSITLNHPQNKILFLGDVVANTGIDIFEDPGLTVGGNVSTSSGNVSIGTFGGNLTLGPGAVINAGSNIILYTDQLFFNNSTNPSPLNAGGFWLIYVGANSGSNFGNLNADFTQYNLQYPNLPSGVGNGILVAVNSPDAPLPPGIPGIPVAPGVFIPVPLDGQTGPLIRNNPINDYSNVSSGIYVQNEDPDAVQKEYEERYATEGAQGAGGTGATTKDIGSGDGVTQFGSDGTSGIPPAQAPPELLNALTNPQELQDAL